MKPSCYIGLVLLMWNVFAHAQSDHIFIDLEQFNKEHNINSNSPGYVVGVYKKNILKYSYSIGLADVVAERPLELETPFKLASLTKQFIAYLVLTLCKEELLTLDDPVSMYIPEIHFQNLTIGNLLYHTSGLPEYWALWKFTDIDIENLDDVASLISKLKNLRYNPGSKYEYCNTNYVLLSLIIERITGESIIKTFKKRVINPFDLKNTFIQLNDSNALKVAKSFEYADESYRALPIKQSTIIGDGGIYSSISDLAIWLDRWYLDSDYEMGRRPGALNNGQRSSYAAGMHFKHFAGYPLFEHGGGSKGASTYVRVFQDQDLAIIVLANTDFVNANQIADLISNRLLSNRIKNTPDSEDSISIQAEPAYKASNTYFGFANGAAGLFDLSVHEDSVKIPSQNRVFVKKQNHFYDCIQTPGLQIAFNNRALNFIYEGQIIGQFWPLTFTEDHIILKANKIEQRVKEHNWTVNFHSDSTLILTTPRKNIIEFNKVSEAVFINQGEGLIAIIDSAQFSASEIQIRLANANIGLIAIQATIQN